MRNYMFRILLSHEERIWVNILALKCRSTIPTIIMEAFEKKSKELGIELPKIRINRHVSDIRREEREQLINELIKELDIQ